MAIKEDTPKRKVPILAKKILEVDDALSDQLFLSAKEILPYSIRKYFNAVQLSCNGIAWISFWIAFTWVFQVKSLAEVQVNILLGLFLDIVVVAIAKAYFRRRRPDSKDQTSFPSGYASRASLVSFFFYFLYPIDIIFVLPIFLWAVAVCLSSVLSQKHYILDVLAGVVFGMIESVIIYVFWISEGTSLWLLSIVTDDKAIVDI